MKKRTIALLLACVMTLGVAIGGTLAWLIDDTDPVENTFTPSDIDIELTETFNKDSDDEGDKPDYWEKKMVPGGTLSKDPKVTVKAGSEACWLFVKVEESSNFDTYLSYEIALDDAATTEVDGWKALDGVDGVYYREVEDLSASATGKEFYVLKNNEVTVNTSVTKAQMNALMRDSDGDGKLDSYDATIVPKLTFTAYAIQSAHLKNADNTDATTAAQAWALLNSATT